MFVKSLMMVSMLSGLAAAQSAGPGTTATVLELPPASEGCPVGLAVERQPEGRVSQVSGASRAEGGQRLSVAFERRETPEPVGAEGVAHGRLPGAGVLLTASPGAAAATERFSVTLAAGKDGLGRSTVPLRQLAGVTWIEVREIHYVDGTTWHASSRSRCVAEPNGLLLVAAP